MKRQTTSYFWLLASLFLLLFPASLQAQITTVSGFNYYDINKNAFLVDASCLAQTSAEEDELGYHFTSFKLANELNNVFHNAQDSLDLVVGDYLFQKRNFLNKTLGGETYHWIMLRPNDTLERPCVLITHGGKDGGSSPLRVMSLGVYDFVQRGYAVVYYQSGPVSGNIDNAFRDAGFTNDCLFGSAADDDMNCFQQAVCMKAQFGIAALEFAAARSASYHVDENMFFISGFSGGGVGSLYAALTDSGDFADAIFTGMGNSISGLSLHPGAAYDLRAVSSLAGGIIDSTSQDFKIGQLIDAGDADTRFLLFHGQDDQAVQPTTAPLFWTDPNDELPGSQIMCALDLQQQFTQYGISHKTIINCSACHGIFTLPCDYHDDCYGNNPLLGGGDCLLWASDSNFRNVDFSDLCAASNNDYYWNEIFYVHTQIQNYSKIAAHYFHQDFADSGPAMQADPFVTHLLADPLTSAVNPVDFPFDEAAQLTNGQLVPSTKCLRQSVTSLFFNRDGSENLLGYKGDYATIGSLGGQTIFNQDFTIEIRFKAIAHTGMGVLFSHINSLTFGFEIFINNNGFLQMKRNALGAQNAITGNTSVLDGRCHWAVLTREGNEFALYLDGILQENKKTFNANFPGVAQPRIGNSNNELGQDGGFNGIMRDFRIWDKALMPAEFAQANLPGTTSNLLADWPLSEGVSQIASSTNSQYEMVLGGNSNNAKYDPRWMRDDTLCACATDITLGISPKQLSQSPMLTAFPNPSNGHVTLQREGAFGKALMLTLYDLQGRQILQTEMREAEKTIFIPAKGLYLLAVEDGQSRSFLKLIVQ